MKRPRRQGPTTVFSAMAFPVYLFMVMDTRYALPVPMYSIRDGRVGCHLEYTMAEAERYVRELERVRVAHRDLYPTICGSVLVPVHSPEELRAMAEHMDPKPDGFFYDCHLDLTRNEWVSTFVPWEKLHGPFRPGLG